MSQPPTVRFVLPLLVFAACGTAPRVRVPLRPQVPMASVTIAGVPAHLAEVVSDVAVYEALVDVSGKKSVTVRAVTSGGVAVERSLDVPATVGDSLTLADMAIPARLRVSVIARSGTPRLELDNKEVALVDGTFEHQFAPEAAGEHRLVAVDATGQREEGFIQLEPGQVTTTELVLHPTAAFKVRVPGATDPEQATASFDQRIEFDGSASGPGEIREFEWDFGDGSRASGRTVTHVYALDQATAASRTYDVSLVVRTRAGGAASEPERKQITVGIARKPLQVTLQTYPNSARTFAPGSAIQFRLAGRSGFLPNDINHVSIDFGDGKTQDTDDSGKPLVATLIGGDNRPALVTHEYAQIGRYRPRLVYSHQTPQLRGPFTGEIWLGATQDPELVVAPTPSTDEQMALRAWTDVHRQLAGLLEATQAKGKRLALTSLRNANFDGKDEAETRLIERLTPLLVADGHSVLERTAQALARLAPESVVDVRKELIDGKPATGTDNQPYRPFLDYGVRVEHKGERDPLHYSIELEGLADRLLQITQTNAESAEHTASNSANPVAAAPQERQQRSNEAISEDMKALRNLPLLVARFATADLVLAFEVQSGRTAGTTLDCDLTTSPPDHYVPALDLPATRRTAMAQVQLRVLDRDSRIVRAVTIVGQHSELALAEKPTL